MIERKVVRERLDENIENERQSIDTRDELTSKIAKLYQNRLSESGNVIYRDGSEGGPLAIHLAYINGESTLIAPDTG